jgi:hypothetical protein
MNDSVEKLASLSEIERTELLEWYKTLPESEEALDALTQTPSRSGKRLWTDNEQLVMAVDALLNSIMGKDSPYQFAGSRMIYRAYRQLQDQHAPYNEYLGEQYFRFFVRKWIIKNDLVNVWEEKSQTRRNKVRIRHPNGYQQPASGFGKKKLTIWKDEQHLFALSMIPLETVWNSQAYYADQPAHADIK